MERIALTDSQMLTEAMEALGLSACLDQFEADIANLPPAECPLEHIFTPGLYTRVCNVPAGTLLTSKIHKTEHPFVVIQGSCFVWTKENGTVRIEAPFAGITKPGTRRVIYVTEDIKWMTFHATQETDVAVIEDIIIEKHENPFLNNTQAPCLESNNNLPSA